MVKPLAVRKANSEKLEFDEVENVMGKKWNGINWWCRKFGDICQAVVDADGWDTKYM